MTSDPRQPARPGANRPAPPRPDQVRPLDPSPIHTSDLPDTPQRDRTIPATAWIEAPDELVRLGADIAEPLVAYKRRIGRWLLWRAGPPSRGDARYLAVASDDLTLRFSFRLHPDGRGEGRGPSGTTHERFRTWKEDLRDDSIAAGFPVGGDSP